MIVIPAYNEREALPDVLAELARTLPELPVVVIDDGSEDGTADVASEWGVPCVRLPFNMGIGAALRAGFRYCAERGCQRAVQFDGDGQHRADQVPLLLAALDEGAHLVIGSRFASSRHRGNKIVNNDPASNSRRDDYSVEHPRHITSTIEPSADESTPGKPSADESTPGRSSANSGASDDYSVGRMRGAAMAMLRLGVRVLCGRRFSDTTSGFRAVAEPLLSAFASDYPVEYMESTEALVAACRAGYRVEEVAVQMQSRAAGTPSLGPVRLAYHYIRLLVALLSGSHRSLTPAPR